MNSKKIMRKTRTQAPLLAIFALAAMPSFAVDLVAVPGQWMPPGGGIPINMWGYVEVLDALNFNCATVDPTATWVVGPTLRTSATAGLTVNLKNCLAAPVSFFVPGLRGSATGGTPGRFTSEVAANGGTATYTFDLTGRSGTFLYHSATDRIRTQVPMGLYGALVVDQSANLAYSDVPYFEDRVLVFSAIDPGLNANPATYGGARVSRVDDPTKDGFNVTESGWNPKYFLINGQSYDGINPQFALRTNQDVLLRFVNAGIETYVPTLGGGLYLGLMAEDGHRYPHPIQQYGLELQAGKTIDAVVNASADGTYALYDRALNLANGGMVAQLVAHAVTAAPTAVDDPTTLGDYTIDEDTFLTTTAGGLPAGVLDNDTGGATVALLVSGPAHGSLGTGLAADGSFTYTPNADYFGPDHFSYMANNGVGGPNSNVAVVSITVNGVADAPMAVADGYEVVAGETLTVAAPGVLGNDSDPDGDALTAQNGTAPTLGTLSTPLGTDGGFAFNAAGLNVGDVATFTYEACDPSPQCSPATTVTISVVATPPPPANIAPTANDDTTSTPRNTSLVNYDILANDMDPDGTIDETSVVITTGTKSQAGGTVINNGDGTITYTPKSAGYRGTDTFQYTVNDNVGATSNVATVRINVVQ